MSDSTTTLLSPSVDVTANLYSNPQLLAAKLQGTKAHEAAQQLEASLFATVLEKMEKNLVPGQDEDHPDAATDSLTAMSVQTLSQALAKQNLLGIANMVEKSLAAKQQGIAPVSGSPKAADKKEKK